MNLYPDHSDKSKCFSTMVTSSNVNQFLDKLTPFPSQKYSFNTLISISLKNSSHFSLSFSLQPMLYYCNVFYQGLLQDIPYLN